MKAKSAKNALRMLAAVLVLVFGISGLGAALAETYAVVYGTKSLNLRADGSVSSQWLGAYSRGTWVTVSGSKNNFYAVSTFDGKTGYMSKNFLQTTDQLTYGNVAIVNNQKATAFLNLRSYPSYSASVITILYNGVPLTVLSQSNGWYHVQMGSIQGYVRSEFTYSSFQPIGVNVGTIKTPNNTAVNMRVAPSTNSSIRHQFAGDRYVSVLYEGTHWWYVCIDGYTGFISSDFLAEGLQAERDIAAQNENNDDNDDVVYPGVDTNSYAAVANPVSSQKLNLRQLPSTAANIVSRLSNGTKLTVLVQGFEWSKVYVSNISATGYVMSRYLTLYNLPAVPMLTMENPQGSFVNLRAAASLTAEVLTRVPDGASATIITPGPDWTEVEYNGIRGYVVNYFTSVADD